MNACSITEKVSVIINLTGHLGICLLVSSALNSLLPSPASHCRTAKAHSTWQWLMQVNGLRQLNCISSLAVFKFIMILSITILSSKTTSKAILYYRCLNVLLLVIVFCQISMLVVHDKLFFLFAADDIHAGPYPKEVF